jgi:hypothetical protein
MPRDGSGVYQLPLGTKAVATTVIASAPYNISLDDFVAEFNSPRPITAGGTGATNAEDAANNLNIPTIVANQVANGTAAQVALFIAYSGVK